MLNLLMIAAVVGSAGSIAALFVFKDRDARGIIFQILTVSLFSLGVLYLVDNTITNLTERSIKTGYGFLERESGFEVSETLIKYGPEDSYGRAFIVGLLNTIQVSVLGIIVATLLGIFVGISSISRNWLVRNIAGAYVHLLRNIPVLLQIVLWHTVITYTLPHPRASIRPIESMFLNQRGFYIPVPISAPGWTAALVALGVAVVLAWLLARWAKARQDRTGQPFPVVWSNTALILGLPALAWLLGGAPTAMDVPELRGFNITGGLRMTPEFAAVLIGLAVYTSAFIAEVVRSGIMAVPHGQTEAGRSVGLPENVIMRNIVLPQALRVIIPPTTNQFLNLTKNSSLAVAVGYPELVSVANTSLNQTGQAIEAISIMMLVYLGLSLLTSAFMNWYNKRIQLVER